MPRMVLLLALLALASAALTATAGHPSGLYTSTRFYASTQTNAPWYQPHAVTCDSPIGAEGVCFRLRGDETSVRLRIVDGVATHAWGTAVFTDAAYGGLGATVWTYAHFCGHALLPVSPGATRLEVYLQPGAHECGASATNGVVVAEFFG